MGPLPDDVSTPDQPWSGQALPTRTSGLAIASFVLSLVWIFGLGSLLAVVFAIIARKNIKRSRGTQNGNGLAIAALVIGILGLLGAGTFFAAGVAISSGIRQATTPKAFPLGATANISAADVPGIKSVTVYSIKYPVKSDGQPDFTRGKEYAAVDIRVCAGNAGSQDGPDLFLLDLLFPGQTTVSSDSFDQTLQPSLSSIHGIGANACVRGYASFEIAKGRHPSRFATGQTHFTNTSGTCDALVTERPSFSTPIDLTFSLAP